MEHVTRWARIVGKFLAGAFIGLHLYALALMVLPTPGTFLMGQRAIEGENVRRDGVPLTRISPHLVRAVIAAEDTRFCQHEGVDPDAIRTAIKEYEDGKGLRGASTITQQTAKNVFFWNGGGAVRKLGDMWMALFVDWSWGKRRVMETYLNVAEWGDGLFGAEAAARGRFGKSAADLTEREAALLAAVLPSPNKWRVDPPSEYVAKRAGTIQARMRVVARQKLDACVWSEATPKPKRPASKPQPKSDREFERKETPSPPPRVPDAVPMPLPDVSDDKSSVPEIEAAPEPARPAVPQVGEDVDLAPLPSPNDEATDALNDFLNSAEETFTPPTKEPETRSDEEASSQRGPKDLRPRPID